MSRDDCHILGHANRGKNTMFLDGLDKPIKLFSINVIKELRIAGMYLENTRAKHMRFCLRIPVLCGTMLMKEGSPCLLPKQPYRIIYFRRHRHLFIDSIHDDVAIVEAAYPELQDYENTFKGEVLGI